jgi:hypothetical protein
MTYANRCRVLCKFKNECHYLIFCSRVIRTTTFRVKTRFVDRLKNNEKFKLNEVVDEVRTRFSTEIPEHRAFKARQVVEGDSSNQYNHSLLWSYSAELRRASAGKNTCKIWN